MPLRTVLLVMLAGLTLVWLAPGTTAGPPGTASAGPPDPLPIFEQRRLPPADLPAAVPGELIVGFEASAPGSARSAAVSGAGASVVRELRLAGHSLVRVPPGREQEFAQRLLAAPGVRMVEPNLIRRALFSPDDEAYPFQWHFPKIGMPSAWDKTTGAGATVAILDTGVAFEDCSPPTCSATFFQAPDFGGTSFVFPRNEISNTAHPNDANGHGTHVASTVGEATNNSLGAAGIAFGANIMPVQVLNAAGVGNIADVVDGIMWARNNGADVLNMSFGAPGGSSTEQTAINAAVADGIVVVAAAGNGGADGIGDPELDCPACYPSTISVGATRFDDMRVIYSNYGAGIGGHTLDIVAPGGDIFVDQNNDTYGDGVLQQTFEHTCLGGPPDYSAFVLCFLEGTSMATPHVTGVAALLLSLEPAMTPQDVRNVLSGTATDRGPAGYDEQHGNGIVNAAAAVVAAQVGPGDKDGDGCTNYTELGPNQSLGGRRDPNNFWDVFDVPTGTLLQRDGAVTVSDISAIVSRFGSFREPPLTEKEALLEAATPPPPPPAYHAAYDRGGPIPGEAIWNLRPPNSVIDASDISAVVGQFGHSCL